MASVKNNRLLVIWRVWQFCFSHQHCRSNVEKWLVMTILFVSKLLITRAGLARFAKMFFSQVSDKLSQHGLGSIQDLLRGKSNNKQGKEKPHISTTRSRERFFPKTIIILCDSFIEEKNLM